VRYRDPGILRDRRAVVLTAAVTACYALLAFVWLSPDAVYTIDAALKFMQARTLTEHHFTTMAIEYQGERLDPHRMFLPFESPFVFPSRGQIQVIFPTAPALLLAPFSYAGFWGMTWVSVLGAGALLLVTRAFARDVPKPWLLPVVVGSATVLWFYAATLSEHAAATACAIGSIMLARRAATPAEALRAGLLLGIATALREEVALIGPGALAASWMAGTRGRAWLRQSSMFVVGGAAVLVGIALLDILVYRRPASAHLLHALAPLQPYLAPGAILPRLRELSPAERWDVVVSMWLLGSYELKGPALLLGALVLGIALYRWRGVPYLLIAVAIVVTAAAIRDTAALLAAPKFVGGLFRLSPFLLAALVPLPRGAASSIARRIALVTSALYVLAMFAVLNTAGGKSLGPRLLLPVIVLVAVAAWEVLVRWAEAGKRQVTAAVLAFSLACLLACSIVNQAGGTIPALAGWSRDTVSALDAVRRGNPPAVIVTSTFLMQLVAPDYFDRMYFFVGSQADASDLAGRLTGADINHFAVAARPGDPLFQFPGYALADSQPGGRVTVQLWRR
jgi:hypothetical protein